jgi:hypothetical protein
VLFMRIPRRREIAVHWASNCVTAFEGQQSSNQRLRSEIRSTIAVEIGRITSDRLGALGEDLAASLTFGSAKIASLPHWSRRDDRRNQTRPILPSTSIIAKSDLAASKKANTSRSNAHALKYIVTS